MAEILTPEVIQAALGLITVVATGLFAWYRLKYKEAADQGDIIMSSARKAWELAKALYGQKPGAKEYIQRGDELMATLEKGWNDSKTKTPEMDDYYYELLKLVAEIGKVEW